MKKTTLLSAALLLSAGQAWAASCSSGSLADYLGMSGGCDIATGGSSSLHFDGFTTYAGLPPGATAIDPASISVTPLLGSGLSFGFNRSAGPGEFLGISFGFSVAAAKIIGASLAMGAAATGSGAVSALQEGCDGGSSSGIGGCSTTSLFLHSLVANAIDSELLASSAFDPPFMPVVFEIGIDGGADGTATLNDIAARFVVPAPTTLSLALLSLGVLGGLSRRRLLAPST